MYLILPSRHKAILDELRKAGFASELFEWEESGNKNKAEFKLTHKPTGFYFTFKRSNLNFTRATMAPAATGVEWEIKTDEWQSWSDFFPKHLSNWLGYLQKEIDSMEAFKAVDSDIGATKRIQQADVQREAPMKNQVQVFLCHANEDKDEVIKVYQRLKEEGFKPWIDEEDLLAGQDWDREIRRVIKQSDVALAFFSKNSVSKRGYYQKELRLLLEVLKEIPPGQVFVIPIRLDECEIHDEFKRYQRADLFETNGFDKIVTSIRMHFQHSGADSLEEKVAPVEALAGESTTLDQWMKESRERFREVAAKALPSEVEDGPLPARFRHGIYELAYKVLGLEQRMKVTEVLELLKKVQISYTGWPVWWVVMHADRQQLRPRPVNGVVEQFVGTPDEPDPSLSDFWRASPEGLLFLTRGYREDHKVKSFDPGTAIQINQPIRNVAEGLAHASRFARSAVGPKAEIIFRVRFEGLDGRRLGNWKPGADPPWNKVIHQPTYKDELVTRVEEIEQDLATLVHRLLESMYASFDFYKLHPLSVQRAIEELFEQTYPI